MSLVNTQCSTCHSLPITRVCWGPPKISAYRPHSFVPLHIPKPTFSSSPGGRTQHKHHLGHGASPGTEAWPRQAGPARDHRGLSGPPQGATATSFPVLLSLSHWVKIRLKAHFLQNFNSHFFARDAQSCHAPPMLPMLCCSSS